MKAPFPYFGGKSTVARVVWAALGQPKHYLEPFFGSGAILLNRPDYNPLKHMETICDKDGYVCNVWRALQRDPDAVAKICDWPVNHADLMARRKVLLGARDLLQRLVDDEEFYDVKLAGYWIWAASCWIGDGLTRPGAMPDTTVAKGVHAKRPHLGHDGRRVCQRLTRRPHLDNDGVGVNQLGSRPQVGVQGAGVHMAGQIPEVRDDIGVFQRGVTGHETRRPCYGPSGAHGVHRVGLFEVPQEELDVRDPYTPGLWTWFRELSERLRRVQVVCGDWTRICGGDWQDDRGTCGIFFDPPYSAEAGRDPKIYQEESLTVAHDVREWCRTRANRKTYRIVLAGYYQEHECLLDEGWTVHRWSAHGGFANRGKGKTQGEVNRHKEALFFSPHCHSDGLRRFGAC